MATSFRKRSFGERCWEVIPGIMFWSTMVGAVLLARYEPVWAAVFIVCFDLYWVLKAFNVASHLFSSYLIFRVHTRLDWLTRLEKLSDDRQAFILQLGQEAISDPPMSARGGLRWTGKRRVARKYFAMEKKRLEKLFADSDVIATPTLRREQQSQNSTSGLLRSQSVARNDSKRIRDYREIYHLVILPFYDESAEVLSSSLDALTRVRYPLDKLFVVLASEERAGESAQAVAREVAAKYGQAFGQFAITVHPDGIEGELKGKSANATWAVKASLPKLGQLGIRHEQVIVSNFDSDTVVHPQYFARVAYEFLTAEKPYRSSYQPIAVYNNNIWDSPALIRVVSVSNSFWQFTESSRTDRLRTFSSHSMPLKTLIEVGFWRVDLVNEDGFIYWQCYLHYNGDYSVVPLFLPISLGTCLAETTWKTLKNQYKQKQRWAYNVEYYPNLIWPLLKCKARWHDKLLKLFQYVEGNYNWATASLLIATLGLMPLFLGGPDFLDTVTAYNLPRMTQFLLRVSLIFLAASVYVNLILLPPRPSKYTNWRSFMMYAQWLLVPIVSLVFGSIPAIDAQTRLMFGKYLGFWVTPKVRKGEITAHTMREMQVATNQES